MKNKISKLEEFIILNVKKKYFKNDIYNLDNITNNEVKIPYLRRMNAFNLSDNIDNIGNIDNIDNIDNTGNIDNIGNIGNIDITNNLNMFLY